MSKKSFNIVTLPGDGIGPDIVGEAVKVMKRIGEIYGYQLQYHPFSFQ